MLAQERFGKFTASEIWKLLVGGKAKGDIFGETAKTYIKEKAVEILTQRRKDSFGSRATDWGNEWEYKAIKEYNCANFVDVEYFGSNNPKFFPCPNFETYAGGSPDFIINNIVGEVKCPYDSINHLDNLNLNTQEDFKKLHKEYYSQIQFNIHCTGSEYAHFVSYDWRFVKEEQQLLIFQIDKDQAHIDLILDKLKIAIDNLNELIN
jgi:hypothetical protein